MIRQLSAISFVLLSRGLAAEYTVIVSKATAADDAWRAVATRLVEKHQGALQVFETSPEELKESLGGKGAPRWICWVARPQNSAVCLLPACTASRGGWTRTRSPIAGGNRDRPGCPRGRKGGGRRTAVDCPDCRRRTSFAADCVERGQWFSEFKAGEMWVKEPGGEVARKTGEADSTASIVRFLNDAKPDAFLTSGHATEHDWQPGYGYRNGSFGHRDGVLSGKALDGSEHVVNSEIRRSISPLAIA